MNWARAGEHSWRIFSEWVFAFHVRLPAIISISQVFSQLEATKGFLTKVQLVETSQAMRAAQKERIQPRVDAMGFTLDWYDSIYDVPDLEEEYTMLVAHEFFDALPIHILQVGRAAHASLCVCVP